MVREGTSSEGYIFNDFLPSRQESGSYSYLDLSKLSSLSTTESARSPNAHLKLAAVPRGSRRIELPQGGLNLSDTSIDDVQLNEVSNNI